MNKKEIEMYIDADEHYPFYILVKPRKGLCDYFKRTRRKVKFSKEKLKEMEDIMKKFEEIQHYLEGLTKWK